MRLSVHHYTRRTRRWRARRVQSSADRGERRWPARAHRVGGWRPSRSPANRASMRDREHAASWRSCRRVFAADWSTEGVRWRLLTLSCRSCFPPHTTHFVSDTGTTVLTVVQIRKNKPLTTCNFNPHQRYCYRSCCSGFAWIFWSIAARLVRLATWRALEIILGNAAAGLSGDFLR